VNYESGVYEGFPTIADWGFQISGIKLDTFIFYKREAYTSEIPHPISEINGF
jgi:hypothetical protein